MNDPTHLTPAEQYAEALEAANLDDAKAFAALETARGSLHWTLADTVAKDMLDAMAYLAARLAADQQKGGGDTVRSDGATQCADCGGWNLPDCPPCCDTPQPSIPAPAQQEVDVDRLRALIANWQTPPTRAGESWITVQARQACAHQLAAALAHPPHADQETQ